MQNKQQTPFYVKLKQQLFNLQFLMNKQKAKVHSIVCLIIMILSTLPILAMLVYNSSYVPSRLFQVLRYFLVSEILQSVNIQCQTIQIVLFSLHILFFIFLVLFVTNQQSNFFAKIAANMFTIFKILMIPVIQFEVHLFKQNQQINVILQLTVCMTAILSILTLEYIYLDFFCLRSKNPCWKFQNKQQVYFYGINIVRLLVSAALQFDIFYLTISLIVQLYQIQRKHLRTKISQNRQEISSNLIISTHVSLLLGNITKNQQFSLQVFVVLSLISLSKCFFYYLKQLIQRNPQMPLCDCNSFEFYDYYFCLKEIIESSHSSEQQVKKDRQKIQSILLVHKLNCKSITCPIKKHSITTKDDKLTQIKQFIKYRINDNAKQSKQSDFVKIVWNYEVEDNLKITIKDKDLSIQEQFIIYFLERQFKQIQNFDEIDKDDQNIQAKVLQFYFYMNEIMKELSNFYSQIAKNQINVLDLICKTSTLKQNSLKLQNIYNILLKRKALTYKMAEIYLYYKEEFLKSQITSEQDRTNKALALHNNKNSNQIEEIHFPVLVLYPDTGNIQNFNMQFLALLKYARTQLKSKNIQEITRPKINLKDQAQRQKFISKGKKNKFFLIDANKKQICINLEVSQRMINGVRLYFLIFKRQKINQNKNLFLINKRFQIQNVLKQESYFKKSKQQIILIKWKDMFQRHILPDKSQLMKHRIIKKRINQCNETLIIVTLEETIQQEYMLIGVTLVVDLIFRQNRVSIMGFSQSNQSIKIQADLQKTFAFYYSLKKQEKSKKAQDYQDQIQSQEQKQLQNVYLYGSNDNNYQTNSFCKDIIQLGTFQRLINTRIVEHTLLNNNVLAKGIKTYRLYENELYNVDLQDKQAYLQQFQSVDDDESRKKQVDQSLSFYMTLFIMLIVCILALFVVVWGFSSLTNYAEIQSNYNKIDQIQIIRIALNQMNGILRDVNNGLYLKFGQNWKLDLNIALTTIQQTRSASQNLFDSDILQMYYQGNAYRGSLNQVLDVLLAKFHLLANTENMTMISSIQNTSINYMVDFLTVQKQNYSSQIQTLSKSLDSSSFDLTYSSLPLMIVFFLMMIKFFSVTNKSLNNRLVPFLKISDKEAKYKAENAQKISYFIEMISKNYDLELKNILNEKNHFQMRKKQKNTTVGLKSKIVLTFLLLCMFSGSLSYLYVMRNNVNSQISQIQNLNLVGTALLEVYTEMACITNQYSYKNYLDTEKLSLLINKMDIVQNKRQNYPFSQQNNQLFTELLYDNICSQYVNELLFANRSTNCWLPTPNFTIQNPYVLGLDYYLRRMHYNIIDNITDTYGSTGIFSFSFASVFQYMAQKINEDSTITIASFENQHYIQCVLLSLSYLLYVMLILILAVRHKCQVFKIKALVNLIKLPHHIKQQKIKKSLNNQIPDVPTVVQGKNRKYSIQRSSFNYKSNGDQKNSELVKNQEKHKFVIKMQEKSKFSRYRQ